MAEATPWIIGVGQVAVLVGVYFRIDQRISSLADRIGSVEQRVARVEGLLAGYLGADPSP